MNNAGYVVLSRQSSLMKELTSIANNIANSDTAGFRREGFLFSEYVQALENSGNSLSQTNIGGRFFDTRTGGLAETGAPFDVAIDGEGYFAVQTPHGERLTRAGSFVLSNEGELSTSEGHALLSESGGPIAIPAEAGTVTIAPDGSVAADGAPLGKIGVFNAPATALMREGANLFKATQEKQPVEQPRVVQGFIEDSNVDPVVEIARLIEVQRAYELGQQLLKDEDERITKTIDSFGRS